MSKGMWGLFTVYSVDYLLTHSTLDPQITYRGRVERGGVYLHSFVRDGRYSERGWGVHSPPPTPGWANFSVILKCMPGSGHCHSACPLWLDPRLLNLKGVYSVHCVYQNRHCTLSKKCTQTNYVWAERLRKTAFMWGREYLMYYREPDFLAVTRFGSFPPPPPHPPVSKLSLFLHLFTFFLFRCFIIWKEESWMKVGQFESVVLSLYFGILVAAKSHFFIEQLDIFINNYTFFLYKCIILPTVQYMC
jgi:hypothetical protein